MSERATSGGRGFRRAGRRAGRYADRGSSSTQAGRISRPSVGEPDAGFRTCGARAHAAQSTSLPRLLMARRLAVPRPIQKPLGRSFEDAPKVERLAEGNAAGSRRRSRCAPWPRVAGTSAGRTTTIDPRDRLRVGLKAPTLELPSPGKSDGRRNRVRFVVRSGRAGALSELRKTKADPRRVTTTAPRLPRLRDR